MDAYECIITKLDVREFAQKRVPGETKRKILEAARLTGSSMNSQHSALPVDSGSLQPGEAGRGQHLWSVGGRRRFRHRHTHQPKGPWLCDRRGSWSFRTWSVAAWNFGVVSRLYTGFKRDELRRDFGVPPELEISAALGFGYPKVKIVGKKDRKPIEDLVFAERYGNHLNANDLA